MGDPVETRGVRPPGLAPHLWLSERVSFPAELPISARVVDLANAIDKHQVIIVAGETGSGKTTQLPKICLALGRGTNGLIGCTQPRRIAATSVATRVAQELDTPLGAVVGYQVRFADKIERGAYIKFMTDGILLAEIQSDPLLRGYDTLIVDEAHERSLNIDFLLGVLKQILPKRPDLRVIISSATLETERFSSFFGKAPVVQVSGRTFPVDVLYRPPTDDEVDLSDTVANAVNEIAEMDPRNDILVFLPGEREIRESMRELEQRALPHTILLPLYARLTAQEQQRVFQRASQRRVVLATNVAETSLTIPGIVYVVDAGVARINRYHVRTGVSQLLVEPVSRASADQRKGRCGRTANGVCFRLYEQQDYESRPSHTDPEIKRVGLAGVILRMKALGLGDIEQFPFLDPPQPRAITEGYRVLEELGALDDAGHLTDIGRELGHLPLDPRLGRMIIGGRDEGSIREVLVIAAALGLQDPRERPQAAQQKADEAHLKFKDDGSDFAGYLKLWAFWQEAKEKLSRSKLYKLCRDNFLNYNRMREWEDIHDQLVRIMKERDIRPNVTPGSADQIHRALLPGLLSKIGMWNQETRNYVGARQTRFVIHPSSGLARKSPPWVMAAELVETSQLFARTVAKIDPQWLEKAGGALCRRSYGDPHWEQKQAQVMAKEQITLYGLPVVQNRSVPFARHDPAKCRELFITHALIRHEYTTKAKFADHNRNLADEVQRLRDKARRSDMFADEYELFEFFDKRLPDTVVSGKTFETWRAEAEARDPRILYLAIEDILLDEATELSPKNFPDVLVIHGAKFALSYKFDPSADDDGITLSIPLAQLMQIDQDLASWTIPGWHRAKVLALLESLPKASRKTMTAIAPLEEFADELAKHLVPFSGPLLPALEKAIYERTGERIARDAWEPRSLPPYLSFGYRVVDEKDKVLGESRDLAELQRQFGARAKELWNAAMAARPAAEPPRKIVGKPAPVRFEERTNLRSWDFGELPRSIAIEVAGRSVQAFPALVETETAVDLRLLESAPAAATATRDGLRRLFVIQMNTTPSKLESSVPGALTKDQKRTIVGRALDEVFQLADPDTFPRDKAAFTKRLSDGQGLVAATIADLATTAAAIEAEHAKAKKLLQPLVGKPGMAKAVVDDVQSQLAHLTPPDLLRTTPLPRLLHVIRYLKGIQIRMQRQANDPPKDQQKASQIAPLWQRWATKREDLIAKGREADHAEYGWMLEELRIAIFAPELKTAVPVSVQRLQDLWSGLVR